MSRRRIWSAPTGRRFEGRPRVGYAWLKLKEGLLTPQTPFGMTGLLVDILPSLKGPEGRGFLLAHPLGGDTFGGFLTRRAYITRRLRTG
jgi:hypothetical protein